MHLFSNSFTLNESEFFIWKLKQVTILINPKSHILVKKYLSGNINTRRRMYQVLLFKFRRHLCSVYYFNRHGVVTKLHHNAKAKWRLCRHGLLKVIQGHPILNGAFLLDSLSTKILTEFWSVQIILDVLFRMWSIAARFPYKHFCCHVTSSLSKRKKIITPSEVLVSCNNLQLKVKCNEIGPTLILS